MENEYNLFKNNDIEIILHDLKEISYINENSFIPRLSFIDFIMHNKIMILFLILIGQEY